MITEKYDIREHLAVLTPTKTKDKYICPVCGGNDFSVNPKNGAYQCFNNQCSPEEVRKALDVVEGKSLEKKPRKAQTRYFEYPNEEGKSLVRVVRIDYENRSKNIWQEHWDGEKWVKGLRGIPRKTIPIYNYHVVKAAIAKGEQVFIVEGEPIVDCLGDLGITATTNLGGAGKWLPEHTQCLKGARVVICPDRDVAGVNHALKIAKDFPAAQWIYAPPGEGLWTKYLKKTSGLDLLDWIEDTYATREDVLALIRDRWDEVEISLLSHNGQYQSKINNGSQGNYHNGSGIKSEEETDIRDELIRLQALSLSQSELRTQLNQLAKKSGVPTNQLEKIYEDLEAESEIADNREETAQRLHDLLRASNSAIKLSEIFPESLANPLNLLTADLGMRPEVLATALLTGISSVQHPSTRIVLNASMGFEVSPNLYAAIVAPSGQRKSPAMKLMVTKPLSQLQAKAQEVYLNERQDYEQQIKRYEDLRKSKKEEDKARLSDEFPDGCPKEPRQKIYYCTSSTIEGILTQFQAHPNQGLLLDKDELIGLFKSHDAYRGGRGEDAQILLSLYDGSGITVLRAKGVPVNLQGSLLSILGGVQPKVLANLLKDGSDEDGTWSRFIFVNQPMQKLSMDGDSGKKDLDQFIFGLYKQISQLFPQTYTLSREAYQLFESIYNHLEEKRVTETKRGMAQVWSKSEGRLGKLAVNLHVIKHALAHEIPPTVIDGETMMSAIALTQFYIDQTFFIYSGLESKSDLAQQYLEILRIAHAQKAKGEEWITARIVQRQWNGSDREGLTAIGIRQWFKELETLKHGTTKGEGNRLKFKVL